jgi:hypothetical protein
MSSKYYRKMKQTTDEKKLVTNFESSRTEMILATQKYVHLLNRILEVNKLDFLLNSIILSQV